MDLKNSPQSNQNSLQEPKPLETEPGIRTMQKDLARLTQEAGPAREKTHLPLPSPRLGRPAPPPEKLPLSPQPIKLEEKPRPKEQTKELPAPAKKPALLRLKFILIGLVVMVIVFGGFLYWWNYIHLITPLTHYECQNYQCLLVEGEGIDQCLSDKDCLPPEPTIPSSLIPVDETETIELIKGQENLLIDKLKTTAAQGQEIGTLRRILIKSVNGQSKYLNFNEFCQIAEIQTPLSENNFTLFLYSQDEGNRLGLVIDIQNFYEEPIFSLLRNWEPEMKTDLKLIFLATKPGPAATEEFQDNIYQNIAIRYLNFPHPDLTIDYAIIDDKLVIATSKDSIYAVIDILLAAD